MKSLKSELIEVVRGVLPVRTGLKEVGRNTPLVEETGGEGVSKRKETGGEGCENGGKRGGERVGMEGR